MKMVYQVDPRTNCFLDRLPINTPLDEPTALQLCATYRTVTACGL